MYLLDTNVISELRKAKPHGAVLAWFRAVRADEIAIPAVVIGEIQDGVEITRKQDQQKAAEIEAWLDYVLANFTVLPMDGPMFREWARLMAGNSDDLSGDAMIAATARVLRMDVVTRNVKDFKSFNVEVFNPFDYAREEKIDRGTQAPIGVLAIQGDYVAHAEALASSGAEPVEVRKPEQMAGLDGLMLPGGESTTFLEFLEKRGFFETLREFCGSKPVFGTCAGAILLAREVLNPPQRSLGVLDAVVERNAYGRQIDSAIVTAETSLAGGPLEMVFIRAPRIVQTGAEVEVLARRDGFATLVRQGRILAATFHPELSRDRRVHRIFVEAVAAAGK